MYELTNVLRKLESLGYERGLPRQRLGGEVQTECVLVVEAGLRVHGEEVLVRSLEQGVVEAVQVHDLHIVRVPARGLVVVIP